MGARLRRARQLVLAGVLAGACTLSSSLDDLQNGAGGAGPSPCASPATMSCQEPGFGGPECNACMALKCCAELSACNNDVGCQAVQGCAATSCAGENLKTCGGDRCASCLVGNGATLWITLAGCAAGCAEHCGVSGTGGAAGAGGGGVGATGGSAGAGGAPEAGDADSPIGCVPTAGPDASCGQMSLGFTKECEGCVQWKCCPQVLACSANAGCWGAVQCAAQHCGSSPDASDCFIDNCMGCTTGLTQFVSLTSCLQSSCANSC